ncbi:hypothetical protein [Aquitalea magnusonii]|uniref:Uncharacterized protein n=1 Tax=Aquitalea magnusonii TaxID=332411 RepID=A0A318JVK4_9NEIS|nr:hypothetical protein [Aquitalea magnusonii]PXX49010.1 hypothetical protein DFR38_10546 [Aquitalea magnusonii]
MEGIYLTGSELEALEGLPDQDFRMYVLMRRWMNLATGVVGGAAGAIISYRRFREWMEVHRERGSTAAPTVRSDDVLRASIARLSRRGLIKRVVRTGLARFVFCYRLLLAKVRSNEEPRVNRDNVGSVGCQAKSRASKEYAGVQQAGKLAAGYGSEPQPSGQFIDKRGARTDSVVYNSDPWIAAAGKLLKKQLSDNEMGDCGLLHAAGRLADIMKKRPVSEQELSLCIAMARRIRGVRSVVSYAVGVVAQGTIEKRLQGTKSHGWPQPAEVIEQTRPTPMPQPAEPAPVQTRQGISAGVRRIRAWLARQGHEEFAKSNI